jgi:hypothetical protein
MQLDFPLRLKARDLCFRFINFLSCEEILYITLTSSKLVSISGITFKISGLLETIIYKLVNYFDI